MARPLLVRGLISELDGLRGLAILLVMVHRFWPRGAVGSAADIVGAGWVGVDLFFVISGFLITGILLDTRDDPGYFRNFYARRVLRIFPLYYLVVISVWVGFSSNPAFREHAGSPLWYLLHLGNIPEGLHAKDVPYWLAPTWSLAIEEQFYLTFPLLVWLVSPRRLAYALGAMIVAAPLIRYVTMLAAPDHERLQYMLTPCRIDTLAAGCLLALLVRRFDVARWRRPATGIALAALAIATMFAFASNLDRTSWFDRVAGYSVVAVACTSVVVLAVLWRGERATSLLRLGPLTYLGKLCFGLYLLHRPADTLVSAVATRAGIDADLRILPVKIVLAVALATLSWHLFERPILRLKARFATEHHPAEGARRAPRAASTLVLLASVLAIGRGGKAT